MTITQKNRALVGGTILVLIVGYYLSIQETLALKQNYTQLQTQEALFYNVPERLQKLQRKEVYYDSLLRHYQISETSLQNNLLQSLNRYAMEHPLTVVAFEEPHVDTQETYTTTTYRFTIKGEYDALLGLAYHLEQRVKFGRIAHLALSKQKSYSTGKEWLEATFGLQVVQ